MIRVVLADDHPIVRQGLRTLLEGDHGAVVVVGEAADGLTALARQFSLYGVLTTGSYGFRVNVH